MSLKNSFTRLIGVRGYARRGGGGPSKPKSLDRKADFGGFLCWICRPSIDKPANNNPYVFSSANAVKEHYKEKHSSIVNSEHYSLCKACGNYRSKDDGINCDFIGGCHFVVNIPERQRKAMRIKEYRYKKNEGKYGADDQAGGKDDQAGGKGKDDQDV